MGFGYFRLPFFTRKFAINQVIGIMRAFLLALAPQPAIICDKFRWRAELRPEVGASLGKQPNEV